MRKSSQRGLIAQLLGLGALGHWTLNPRAPLPRGRQQKSRGFLGFLIPRTWKNTIDRPGRNLLTGHGMSLGHPLSNIVIAAVPIARVPARPTTPGSSCRLPKAVAARRAPPPITTAFGSTPRQLLAQVRVLFSKSCGKFLLSERFICCRDPGK